MGQEDLGEKYKQDKTKNRAQIAERERTGSCERDLGELNEG